MAQNLMQINEQDVVQQSQSPVQTNQYGDQIVNENYQAYVHAEHNMPQQPENQPYLDNSQGTQPLTKKRSTSHQNLSSKKRGGNFKVNRQFMQVYQDMNIKEGYDARKKSNGGKGTSGQSLDSKRFHQVGQVTADDMQNQAVAYEGGNLADYGNSKKKGLARPMTQQLTRGHLVNKKLTASMPAEQSQSPHHTAGLSAGNFAPVLAQQHKYYNNNGINSNSLDTATAHTIQTLSPRKDLSKESINMLSSNANAVGISLDQANYIQSKFDQVQMQGQLRQMGRTATKKKSKRKKARVDYGNSNRVLTANELLYTQQQLSQYTLNHHTNKLGSYPMTRGFVSSKNKTQDGQSLSNIQDLSNEIISKTFQDAGIVPVGKYDKSPKKTFKEEQIQVWHVNKTGRSHNPENPYYEYDNINQKSSITISGDASEKSKQFTSNLLQDGQKFVGSKSQKGSLRPKRVLTKADMPKRAQIPGYSEKTRQAAVGQSIPKRPLSQVQEDYVITGQSPRDVPKQSLRPSSQVSQGSQPRSKSSRQGQYNQMKKSALIFKPRGTKVSFQEDEGRQLQNARVEYQDQRRSQSTAKDWTDEEGKSPSRSDFNQISHTGPASITYGKSNVSWRTKEANTSVSAVFYHNDSERVPQFYNRTGPGQYENNKNLDKVSTHARSPLIGFGKDGLNQGTVFEGKLGGHRFTDYEKSRIAFDLVRKRSKAHSQKRTTKPSANSSQNVAGIANVTQGQVHDLMKYAKPVDILYPTTQTKDKDPKMHGFPKHPRPELFPVKPEHSEPLNHIKDNRDIKTTQGTHLKQTAAREFQKSINPKMQRVGPGTYVIPHDPSKSFTANSSQRPLSNQVSFLNQQRQTGFGVEERHTIFSGKFARYESMFVNDLSNAHEKQGPGPQHYDPFNPVEKLHFESKNVSKSILPKSKRKLGVPNPAHKYKAATGQYEAHDHKNGTKPKQKDSTIFAKVPRRLDFVKHAMGMEEFTIKGLL